MSKSTEHIFKATQRTVVSSAKWSLPQATWPPPQPLRLPLISRRVRPGFLVRLEMSVTSYEELHWNSYLATFTSTEFWVCFTSGYFHFQPGKHQPAQIGTYKPHCLLLEKHTSSTSLWMGRLCLRMTHRWELRSSQCAQRTEWRKIPRSMWQTDPPCSEIPWSWALGTFLTSGPPVTSPHLGFTTWVLLGLHTPAEIFFFRAIFFLQHFEEPVGFQRCFCHQQLAGVECISVRLSLQVLSQELYFVHNSVRRLIRHKEMGLRRKN